MDGCCASVMLTIRRRRSSSSSRQQRQVPRGEVGRLQLGGDREPLGASDQAETDHGRGYQGCRRDAGPGEFEAQSASRG